MPRPSSDQFKQLNLTYAICTAIICIKVLVVKFSAINKSTRPPEDAAFGAASEPISGTVTVSETVQRKERMLANDVENIPLNLVVFWGAYILQSSVNNTNDDEGKEGTQALTALFIIYTIARVGHSVCYLFALQPARSISFLIGELTFLMTLFLTIYNASHVNYN